MTGQSQEKEMPKQTFTNLTEEKRKKIIKAALDEFASKGFRESSINTIVQNAMIPKGSFYQYFEDKKDLFKHICSLAAAEKFKYLEKLMPEAGESDFFDLLREMIAQGIRFGKDHPEYYCISNELLNDRALMSEIFGEQTSRTDDFFQHFINAGIKRGDIRNDLDVTFISRMITSLGLGLGEYFIEKHGFENIERIDEYTDNFILILKNGIAGR